MSHTATSRRTRGLGGRAAILAVSLLPIAACGGDTDDATSSSPAPVTVSESDDTSGPSFGLVTPDQASTLAADPAVAVIDVRTPDEFAEGHIEGAVMIDFYADSFADEIAALDTDATYLVYCRSGNRSGQTTALMAELGFAQVYDLDGGVVAWNAEGGPLVR